MSKSSRRTGSPSPRNSRPSHERRPAAPKALASPAGDRPQGEGQHERPDAAPLAGLRILDLTRLLPGPAATMHLADFGADVIKIEDTGDGDYMRDFAPQVPNAAGTPVNPAFEATNRGKRSMCDRPEEPARPRIAARPRRHGRCADRELPAGRAGAAGPRMGRSARAQSAPGAVLDLRLRADRAAGTASRPRHQLHRHQRRARPDPDRGSPGRAEPSAGRPARRRTRRAFLLADRSAGGAAHRPGSLDRRGDDRSPARAPLLSPRRARCWASPRRPDRHC